MALTSTKLALPRKLTVAIAPATAAFTDVAGKGSVAIAVALFDTSDGRLW
jgi:hypothetical protein